jgi:hypothetical protein
MLLFSLENETQDSQIFGGPACGPMWRQRQTATRNRWFWRVLYTE